MTAGALYTGVDPPPSARPEAALVPRVAVPAAPRPRRARPPRRPHPTRRPPRPRAVVAGPLPPRPTTSTATTTPRSATRCATWSRPAPARRPLGPVRTLTQVRTWGYLFNPITVTTGGPRGRARRAAPPDVVVLEVTNTPWKERHWYVVEARPGADPSDAPGPVRRRHGRRPRTPARRVPQGAARVAVPAHGPDLPPLLHPARTSTLAPARDLRRPAPDGEPAKVFDADLALRREPLTRAGLARRLLAPSLRHLPGLGRHPRSRRRAGGQARTVRPAPRPHRLPPTCHRTPDRTRDGGPPHDVANRRPPRPGRPDTVHPRPVSPPRRRPPRHRRGRRSTHRFGTDTARRARPPGPPRHHARARPADLADGAHRRQRRPGRGLPRGLVGRRRPHRLPPHPQPGDTATTRPATASIHRVTGPVDRRRPPAAPPGQAPRPGQHPGPLRPRQRLLRALARRDDDVPLRRVRRRGTRRWTTPPTEKLDRLCRRLDLGPGDHVVEIGTGWGGFAVHAARHLRLPGHDHHHQPGPVRVRHRPGGRGRAWPTASTVRHDDYRDLTGTYDKLVSIEMIEAVDWRELDTFFAALPAAAAPRRADGAAGHRHPSPSATSGPRTPRTSSRRSSSPAAACRRSRRSSASISRVTDLTLTDVDDFGLHYAETLRRWQANLARRRRRRSRRPWVSTSASCACGTSTSATARPPSTSGRSASCRWRWPAPPGGPTRSRRSPPPTARRSISVG